MDPKMMRYIGVAACGLAAIGVFLPWAKTPSFDFGGFGSFGGITVSGMSMGGGIITLLASLATGLFIFANVKLSIIGPGISILMCVICLATYTSYSGIGLYLSLVGSIVAGVIAFPMLKSGGGFDSIGKLFGGQSSNKGDSPS